MVKQIEFAVAERAGITVADYGVHSAYLLVRKERNCKRENVS